MLQVVDANFISVHCVAALDTKVLAILEFPARATDKTCPNLGAFYEFFFHRQSITLSQI